MNDNESYAKIHAAALLDESMENTVHLQIEIPRGMFDAQISGVEAMRLIWRARVSRTEIDLKRLDGMAVIVAQTSPDTYRFVSLA